LASFETPLPGGFLPRGVGGRNPSSGVSSGEGDWDGGGRAEAAGDIGVAPPSFRELFPPGGVATGSGVAGVEVIVIFNARKEHGGTGSETS